MDILLLQFSASAIVIIIAGSFLTTFSDKIATATGWGRLFVGGLLLAGATSLPELLVDMRSIEMGLPNMAVGDLLGSSLFNLLILATLDFTFPSAFKRTAFSPKYLHHALGAVLTIVLTAVIAIGIVSRVEISFGGVSLFIWLTLIIYLYGLRLIFIEANNKEAIQQAPVAAPAKKYRSILGAFGGYFASASIILVAAPYLVQAADEIAKRSSLGHTFIGTTLVAITTSLPELVSTLAAFRMGAPDLALGNIFGSNAFNMILFFPLDWMYPKTLLSSIKVTHAVTALSVIAATSIAVMGQLYRKKERSRFAEPSSETVVVVIILFLLLLYGLVDP